MNDSARVSRGIRPTVVVAAVIGIVCILLMSTSYSWLLDSYGLVSGQRMGRLMRSLNSQQRLLDFSINNDARLLPGSTIHIADGNRVLPHNAIGDFLFRITYTVQDDSGGLAKEIALSPEIIQELDLVEYGSGRQGATLTLAYYGRHQGNSPTDLGPLLLTCGTDTSPAGSSGIKVNAELLICQNEAAAFCDIFDVPEEDLTIFAHLMEGEDDDDDSTVE